jgi:hypothetical protein
MYALSLLGTARPGVNSARQSMQAAAIAVDVVPAPSTASRRGALSSSTRSTIPITRFWRCPRRGAYAKIAPSAAHALHMPSHIFVQLGLWDDVIASNVVAYKGRGRHRDAHEPAARTRGLPHAVVAPVRLPAGREVRRSAKALATAKAVSDKDPSPGVANGYASMKARQVVETHKWEKLPLPTGAVREGGAPATTATPRTSSPPVSARRTWTTWRRPMSALEKLKAMRTQAETGLECVSRQAVRDHGKGTRGDDRVREGRTWRRPSGRSRKRRRSS